MIMMPVAPSIEIFSRSGDEIACDAAIAVCILLAAAWGLEHAERKPDLNYHQLVANCTGSLNEVEKDRATPFDAMCVSEESNPTKVVVRISTAF